MTRTYTILGWGALIALAAIAIATALSLRALLVDSAESYLKTLGDKTVSLLGTRIPCMGYFDVGFTVHYEGTRFGNPSKEKYPFVGRICRPIISSDWVWYPDPNQGTR